jgi:hypothetical protein
VMRLEETRNDGMLRLNIVLLMNLVMNILVIVVELVL